MMVSIAVGTISLPTASAVNSPTNLSSGLGSFLYFSSRFVAIASSLILAVGYSLSTSHISFFDSTNRSLYPTDRTDAVRLFPVDGRKKKTFALRTIHTDAQGHTQNCISLHVSDSYNSY